MLNKALKPLYVCAIMIVGASESLRQHVQRTQKCDVLIDSTAPLLYKVLTWLSKVFQGETGARRVLIQSRCPDFYHVIRGWLSSYGYKVYDSVDTDSRKSFGAARIVYERSSYETVDSVHTIVKNGLADVSRVCAIVDKHPAADEIRQCNEQVQ